ncbi:hypothetical protein KC19_2G024500 [Ceratodon purpureus]|uniref:Reverse transcriptase zinc-binding domain-containing protein n=1 Tax=Ceratodon purpureus TaxID=3225 RepID=A0A8T0IQZ7_CERPU|nr:hypothetical protein KC19_2G024500 [Ceratodon purpureus]
MIHQKHTCEKFTALKGRKLLSPRTCLTRPINLKWAGQVPLNFQPDWKAVWSSSRPRKEAAFLWSLIHKAVAVNEWRHRAIPAISALCDGCTSGTPETILHCFYACEPAARAWHFAATVLHLSARSPWSPSPRPLPTWDQCILGVDLPNELQESQVLWSLIRGATLWVIWIQRNQRVFHNNLWPVTVLEQQLWDAFLDLAHVAWNKISWCEENQPQGITRATEEFRTTWLPVGLFFTLTERGPRWNYQRPPTDLFLSP